MLEIGVVLSTLLFKIVLSKEILRSVASPDYIKVVEVQDQGYEQYELDDSMKLDPNDFDVVMFETHTKRILQASNTTSTAAGNGTVNIEPFKMYTVTVTSRASNSALRNNGEDKFYVRIQNECTYSNQTTCTEVGGAANTVPTPYEGLMTYNGDSTYSYNYILSVTGKISVTVFLRNTGRVMIEWHRNEYLSNFYSNAESTQINFYWSSGGYPCCGRYDYISAKFRSYLRPNISGTYTIYTNSDRGARLYVEGTAKINYWNSNTNGLRGFSMALTKDTNYYIEAHYQETTSSTYYYLEWIVPGTSRIVVPPANFVWPEFVTTAPFTIDIVCPTGYTHTNTDHPNECYPVCGDSMRVGAEVCDDGNTLSNDGCAEDCLSVETNCTCTGGSTSQADYCSCLTSFVNETVVEEYSTASKVMVFAVFGVFTSVSVAAIVVAVIVELRQPIQYSQIQQRSIRVTQKVKVDAQKKIEADRRKRSTRYEA
ncbi:unnamed protein product [Moneuplotes crassus]|uniref:PA14 domain-containing protein n=1 Tax=Euplotes crassus TaxID=5936 RepID=A0AAD1XA21_EUPCR|nr:unnamed protein product [Moneuplotes crassus]